MSEAGMFIGLIWSMVFNCVFLLLGTMIFRKNIIDWIRKFFYARKGFGIVFMIRRDKRIVEYFTKITGEKIRINKNTYITNPNYLNFYSKISQHDDPHEKIVKLQEKLDNTDDTPENKKLRQKYISSIKKLKEFIKHREESMVELGSKDPTKMLLKGNMPCYFYKEGSIEPIDLAETKMGEISSKHMDDIVVDALTAPRGTAASWFAENKRMLTILFILIAVGMFIFIAVLQGNPDAFNNLLVG